MGLFFFYVARQGGCALGWFVAPGGRFGQCEGKKAVLSPKLGRVRTEEGEIGVTESEVGASSDRRRGNYRF